MITTSAEGVMATIMLQVWALDRDGIDPAHLRLGHAEDRVLTKELSQIGRYPARASEPLTAPAGLIRHNGNGQWRETMDGGTFMGLKVKVEGRVGVLVTP